MPNKTNVADKRQDVSHFVVHLTRDAIPANPATTARQNLMKILTDRKIEARNPHCYHNLRLAELPQNVQSEFKVVCFTEAPLDQLHHLTGKIEGRQILLQPYGLIFKKKFLLKSGAQPAIYLNGYDGNAWLKEAARDLFNELRDNGKTNRATRFLPFLNAMHERYDFSWEREWRVQGNFTFGRADVVATILPENGEEALRDGLAEIGMAVVSPGWTYEQIVGELATQQSITKKALTEKLAAIRTNTATGAGP
jgi:hypothetical protein